MKIVLTLLSITGVILNARKKRVCFIIWFFTNTAWAIVDFSHGLWEQGTLFVIYVGLAIYGWLSWKNKSIWHSMDEAPENGEQYILKLKKGGIYHSTRTRGLSGTDWEYAKEDSPPGSIAWAYTKDLPK